MKGTFVLIFRKEQRELSDEEQKQRTEEVRGWAMQQIKDGRNLEPRVLGDKSYFLGEGTNVDRRVIAFNFIEAEDFAEAAKIANTHPGLRYGVQIEVRPWTDPRSQRNASK
jgi:hypothetical protein